jgi:hypothetical protein
MAVALVCLWIAMWVEGQTHNLGAVPAAAMMKEFFVDR